jgi:inhibitor of cysteine peptidase
VLSNHLRSEPGLLARRVQVQDCGMEPSRYRGRADRRRLLLLLLATAFVALPLCLHPGQVLAGTVNLTDADNYRTLRLAVGDMLIVSLASTPGTGFSWDVARVDARVMRQMGGPKLVYPAKPIPGAPATQVFRFIAKSPGAARLELVYRRPWERGVPPARRFKVNLKVR